MNSRMPSLPVPGIQIVSHEQTKSFIYDVEHALVEHRAGLLSEEELRRELTSRIEQARMSMLDGAGNR